MLYRKSKLPCSEKLLGPPCHPTTLFVRLQLKAEQVGNDAARAKLAVVAPRHAAKCTAIKALEKLLAATEANLAATLVQRRMEVHAC